MTLDTSPPSPIVVLDVVKAFPGGRVGPGDVFVVDPSDPRLPISEIRYHGPELLSWLEGHLSFLRCRDQACASCSFASACPLRSGLGTDTRPRLRLVQ